MTVLFLFLSFLILQRLVELFIARRHEKYLVKLGAVEVDKRGYRIIVIMHAAFFLSIVLESYLLKRTLNDWWMVLIVVFAAAQILRYWAIASLGAYWNTKIIVAPDHPVIRKGPYRFMRHPNYIAVATEIAVVPLIFSCYITAALFTVLNALLLRRRIRLETDALGSIDKQISEIKKPDGITI